VRCTFSGFEGKVGGRAIYINGCARVYVIPAFDKDANIKIEGQFFPEGGLESVSPPQKEFKKETRGGPEMATSFRDETWTN
jgi:hypothetical protein